MEGRILTTDIIDDFRKNLILQEKSTATIEKYIRDVKAFSVYARGRVITKEMVIAYKNNLQENFSSKKYFVSSSAIEAKTGAGSRRLLTPLLRMGHAQAM